ncbi:hypothetical protein JTB14_008413 [Gonioctena quinquepunctata]|nr:hypothetical protein JTB14_008413 [Gonioctena quinquepunctata]
MLRKVEMAEIVSERPVASLTSHIVSGNTRASPTSRIVDETARSTHRIVSEAINVPSTSGIISKESEDIFENSLVTAENEISSDDEVEANDKENEMDIDDEANDEVLNSERSEEKLKKGSWVLGKYGNSSYVGKVVDIKGNNAKTMFHRKNGLYFVYPHQEFIEFDQEFIEFETIQQILEEPYIQRGKHYFKMFDIELGTVIN